MVPAKGVERWLTQRLSHRLGVGPRGGDGVCAGVRFLTPRSLVSLLLDRDRDDPGTPDRLVWPLLAAIDASLDEPWCRDARRAPRPRPVRRRRRPAARPPLSVARRLARLFAAYAVQRPAAGHRLARGPAHRRRRPRPPRRPRLAGAPVAGAARQVGTEPPDVRLARAVALLEAGGDGLDLPGRLSLFGHTRLPVTEVRLLQALAATRDVHLWLPHALAGAVGRPRRTSAASCRATTTARPSGSTTRCSPRSAATPASCGAPSRCRRSTSPWPPTSPAPRTLLGWLQHDLRANHAPTLEERATRPVDAADRSLQVHACHGPARQIDVLREVLVGLLDDDPTLQPRDILVMCPDIETYAPLVSAGFGLADVVEGDAGHPAHGLRVRLADRALTSTNPLLAVAASLVELAGGRATASDVLDLAATPAVRLRLRPLRRRPRPGGPLGAGVRRAVGPRRGSARRGSRWTASRTTPGGSGLDRVLLGVAMSGDDHRHVGRRAPRRRRRQLRRRPRRPARRAGRPARRLRHRARRRHRRRRVDGRAARRRPRPHRRRPRRRLAAAAARARAGPGGGRVRRGRGCRRRAAAGRRPGAARRRGWPAAPPAPTSAPARSRSARWCRCGRCRTGWSCLVGLDDGVFPRLATVDGDDVLARHPLTGERDVRSEDRQLLLDALLAATERVVITYTGANEHSGASPAAGGAARRDPRRRRPHPARRRCASTCSPATRCSPTTRATWCPAPCCPPTRGRSASTPPRSTGPRAAAGVRVAAAAAAPRPAARARRRATSRSPTSRRSCATRCARSCGSGSTSPRRWEPDEIGDAIPIELDALDKWAGRRPPAARR